MTVTAHPSHDPLPHLLELTGRIRLAEIARHQRWRRRHPVHSIQIDEAHLRFERAVASIENDISELLDARRNLRRLHTLPDDRTSR